MSVSVCGYIFGIMYTHEHKYERIRCALARHIPV